MAEKLIAVPESKLTEIADAIRLKRDIVTSIPVEDMPLQIGLIEGSGSYGIKKVNISSDGKSIDTDLTYVPTFCVLFSQNAEASTDAYIMNFLVKSQQSPGSYMYGPSGAYPVFFIASTSRINYIMLNGKFQIRLLDSGYDPYNVSFDTTADYFILTIKDY